MRLRDCEVERLTSHLDRDSEALKHLVRALTNATINPISGTSVSARGDPGVLTKEHLLETDDLLVLACADELVAGRLDRPVLHHRELEGCKV